MSETANLVSENRLADNHMSMTIDEKPIQPARQPIRPMQNGRTGFPAWCRRYFTLGCALFYLGVWTATPGTHAMQSETLTVHSSQAVCGNQCAMAHCRLSVPSFEAPAVPNTAIGQWVWNHPMETESPDTELTPVKCTIIPGARPSTIAVSGHFTLSSKRTISRLYLQTKSLLC